MKAMNELRVQLSPFHTISVINHQSQTIITNIAEVQVKIGLIPTFLQDSGIVSILALLLFSN